MKKLNLNETWKLCLKMWRWIAKEYKNGNEEWVSALKIEWLRKHGFKKESICNDCFFCEYGEKHHVHIKTKCIGCSDCPGTRIDSTFSCTDSGYRFDEKPIAFYNKLLKLNRKRKK